MSSHMDSETETDAAMNSPVTLQTLAVAGSQPGWRVLDIARTQQFTGEIAFETDPAVCVYFDHGVAYHAARAGDVPLCERLVEAGVAEPAELERGVVRVGNVENLGRLFDRVPSIDRDAVMVVLEVSTESIVSEIANDVSVAFTMTAYRHHVSGVHRWFVSSDDASRKPAQLTPVGEVAQIDGSVTGMLPGLDIPHTDDAVHIEWDQPVDDDDGPTAIHTVDDDLLSLLEADTDLYADTDPDTQNDADRGSDPGFGAAFDAGANRVFDESAPSFSAPAPAPELAAPAVFDDEPVEIIPVDEIPAVDAPIDAAPVEIVPAEAVVVSPAPDVDGDEPDLLALLAGDASTTPDESPADDSSAATDAPPPAVPAPAPVWGAPTASTAPPAPLAEVDHADEAPAAVVSDAATVEAMETADCEEIELPVAADTTVVADDADHDVVAAEGFPIADDLDGFQIQWPDGSGRTLSLDHSAIDDIANDRTDDSVPERHAAAAPIETPAALAPAADELAVEVTEVAAARAHVEPVAAIESLDDDDEIDDLAAVVPADGPTPDSGRLSFEMPSLALTADQTPADHQPEEVVDAVRRALEAIEAASAAPARLPSVAIGEVPTFEPTQSLSFDVVDPLALDATAATDAPAESPAVAPLAAESVFALESVLPIDDSVAEAAAPSPFGGFAPPTMNDSAEAVYARKAMDAEAAAVEPGSGPASGVASVVFVDEEPDGDDERAGALKRLIGSLRRK